MTRLDPPTTPTDKQLLAAYVNGEDAAFEQILNRHGPMAMGVCRRILRGAADADDAFQATFLALVESASTIRCGESLGGWLYRTAYRVAVRIRARARHQIRKLELFGREMSSRAVDVENAEILAELDEAIEALPDAERTAIVLCELEGRKHREVARLLGVPVSTISNRVDRGRKRLRCRLRRRGLAMQGALLSAAIQPLASEQMASAAIVKLTLVAARQVRESGLTSCTGVSSKVVAYAKSIVAAMSGKQVTTMMILAVAAICLGFWRKSSAEAALDLSQVEIANSTLAVRQVVQVDRGSRLWGSSVAIAANPSGNSVPPRNVCSRPFAIDDR